MEVGPPASACGGRRQTTLCLRWLKTVVVSEREKAHGMRQVGFRKTYQKRQAGVTRLGVVVKRRNWLDDVKTRGPPYSPGTSLADARRLARRHPA